MLDVWTAILLSHPEHEAALTDAAAWLRSRLLLVTVRAGTLPHLSRPVRAAGDTNFLEWLSETVAEAARTADQHEALKRAIRELRVSVEARFGLASVQVRRRCRSPGWLPLSRAVGSMFAFQP